MAVTDSALTTAFNQKMDIFGETPRDESRTLDDDDDSLWTAEMPTPMEDGESLIKCFEERCQDMYESVVDLITEQPIEMVFKICEFLEVKSILAFGTCSKYLNSLTSRNEASWLTKCNNLWKEKNVVCEEAKMILSQKQRFKRVKCECCDSVSHCQNQIFKSVQSYNAKIAYKTAVIDAKQRHEITIDELRDYAKFNKSFLSRIC